MSSTFDGSKVSGLANMLDDEIESWDVQEEDPFDSEDLFRLLKDDSTYNIKNQLEQIDLDDTQFLMTMTGDKAAIKTVIAIPSYEYDAESDSWSTTLTDSMLPITVFMSNAVRSSQSMAWPSSADLEITFGQYTCEMAAEFVPEGTSGEVYHFSCTEPSWHKVSFN